MLTPDQALDEAVAFKNYKTVKQISEEKYEQVRMS